MTSPSLNSSSKASIVNLSGGSAEQSAFNFRRTRPCCAHSHAKSQLQAHKHTHKHTTYIWSNSARFCNVTTWYKFPRLPSSVVLTTSKLCQAVNPILLKEHHFTTNVISGHSTSAPPPVKICVQPSIARKFCGYYYDVLYIRKIKVITKKKHSNFGLCYVNQPNLV